MQVGIDVVDINELKNLAIKSWFIKYAFAPEEIEISKDFSYTRKIEFLSARFCCKEAIYKSLDIKNRKLGFRPASIVIFKNSDGSPRASLKPPYKEKEGSHLFISISHKSNLCISVAILKENNIAN